ncbi:MAG: glycosyltransferase [Bacteroidia bacterium]
MPQINTHNDYAVVMIGLFRSDQLLSSTTISLAAEWCKTKQVIYIDRPYSFKDFWQQRKTNDIKSKFTKFGLRKYKYRIEQKDNKTNYHVLLLPLLIPCAFLSDGFIYKQLNKLNNFIIKKEIEKTLKHFNIKKYIFINSFLPSVPPNLLGNAAIKPLLNIYQTVDDISQEPYIAKHGVREEKEAFELCDLGIATSTGLSKKYNFINGKKIVVVANAADFSLFENAKFNKYPLPDELKNIAKPIILYTGHYSSLRFNHKLVLQIANKFKNCSLVFVGSFNPNDVQKHGLKDLPNVYFTGLKPITALPAFIHYSNVAIIPYAANQLTANIYPLKINEYLASGIPTVTSNFSEDIPTFAPEAYVANSDEEFLHHIEKALSEDFTLLAEKRMQKAKVNTWQSRIEQLSKLIDERINKI